MQKTVTGLTLLLLTLVSGCESRSVPIPVTDSWKQPLSTQHIHKVRDTETIYTIAWRYGLDYRQIAQINHLSPPYKITRGQYLQLKGNPSQVQAAAASPIVKMPTVSPATRKEPVPAAASSAFPLASTVPAPAPKPAATSPIVKAAPEKLEPITLPSHPNSSEKWRWPLLGKLTDTFGTKGSKGINIAAPLGTPVTAAQEGRVVYAGSGLRGYGQLLIIKHNDEFFSAYAHNSQLLVHEGAKVKAGQVIAKVGDTEANRAILHFEIRRAGKPVDPLRYLPKL